MKLSNFVLAALTVLTLSQSASARSIMPHDEWDSFMGLPILVSANVIKVYTRATTRHTGFDKQTYTEVWAEVSAGNSCSMPRSFVKTDMRASRMPGAPLEITIQGIDHAEKSCIALYEPVTKHILVHFEPISGEGFVQRYTVNGVAPTDDPRRDHPIGTR